MNRETAQLVKKVLTKFDLPYKESVLAKVNNRVDSPAALRVANKIESIEDSWSYDHSGERSYGQKIAGETIKLWSIPKTTALFLEYLTVATKSKNIVEIGTSGGYSTLYLAMGASYNKGKVTTIESLPVKVELAQRNFADSGLHSISLRSGNARDILTEFDGPIDLVFLDADKENYGKYLKLILPKLRVGGFIVADNVFDYGHMMKDYLDKVMGTKLPGSQSDKRVRSYLLPVDNGILITQKVSA